MLLGLAAGLLLVAVAWLAMRMVSLWVGCGVWVGSAVVFGPRLFPVTCCGAGGLVLGLVVALGVVGGLALGCGRPCGLHLVPVGVSGSCPPAVPVLAVPGLQQGQLVAEVVSALMVTLRQGCWAGPASRALSGW